MTPATAKELRRRLAVRFGRSSSAILMPEHAVLFEVPVDGARRIVRVDGTPSLFPVRRRIDAVAVGLWKRTGHLVHGFEIKVTRSDLLSELRQPEKAEAGFRLCDRWWLVLSDPGLLRDGDQLPEGWGVLACRGRGLGVVVEAGQAGGEHGGRFIAALVQSAIGGRGSVAHALGYQSGYWRGYEQARKTYARGW